MAIVTNSEAVTVIKAYTKNLRAAAPDAPAEVVDLTAAAAFTKYMAAAVDPGKYAYYPHPYNEAETTLHNAAKYLALQAEDVAAVSQMSDAGFLNA